MSAVKDSGKWHRSECTGVALETAKKHAKKEDITFFAACFCPYVHRIWVAFEYLGIPYQYYEIDPYKKPKPADLLEVSPKGLVPALKLSNVNPPRPLNESMVIVEYLEDLAALTTKKSLLPPNTDPYARALVRLQTDHINRTLIPAFYRFLLPQDEEKQLAGLKEFLEALQVLTGLLDRAERESDDKRAAGLWREDGELNLTDISIVPWLFRATNVLKFYRGFSFPPGEKFEKWLKRLFEHPAVKATCSTEDLYIDSYERYAYNRPNVSQMQQAINTGGSLP